MTLLGKIDTEIFTSIAQISRVDWNSVAGDSIGLNYAMLLCREKNAVRSGEPRYFCVREADTVMAVSVAVICSAEDEGVLTQRLFGRLAGTVRLIAKSLDRTLACGQIPAPGAAVMTSSGIPVM